jgi:hypothetical protein
MRDAAALRYQAWLQREVGDPKLRVRWDGRIERFVVGRLVSSMASDFVDWFLIVSDGESGYRPIDHRTVRKIVSLDTWKRDKPMTEEEFIAGLEQKRTEDRAARAEVLKYRLKHESRYIKKAAIQDGMFS